MQIAWMLAMSNTIGVALLWIGAIERRTARRELREARTRAVLAEGALADIRLRRSLAVSKGNRLRRTRADQRKREQLDRLRDAIVARDMALSEGPAQPVAEDPDEPRLPWGDGVGDGAGGGAGDGA